MAGPGSRGKALVIHRLERPDAGRGRALVDALDDFARRDDIVFGPPGSRAARAFAHRHVLDEAHVQGPVERQLGEREEVLVEATHRDGVDLDGVEAMLEGSIYAGEHVLDLAPRVT